MTLVVQWNRWTHINISYNQTNLNLRKCLEFNNSLKYYIKVRFTWMWSKKCWVYMNVESKGLGLHECGVKWVEFT